VTAVYEVNRRYTNSSYTVQAGHEPHDLIDFPCARLSARPWSHFVHRAFIGATLTRRGYKIIITHQLYFYTSHPTKSTHVLTSDVDDSLTLVLFSANQLTSCCTWTDFFCARFTLIICAQKTLAAAVPWHLLAGIIRISILRSSGEYRTCAASMDVQNLTDHNRQDKNSPPSMYQLDAELSLFLD
jgi:hypothetical protein